MNRKSPCRARHSVCVRNRQACFPQISPLCAHMWSLRSGDICHGILPPLPSRPSACRPHRASGWRISPAPCSPLFLSVRVPGGRLRSPRHIFWIYKVCRPRPSMPIRLYPLLCHSLRHDCALCRSNTGRRPHRFQERARSLYCRDGRTDCEDHLSW